jgi:phosphocarrier protein FPr
VIVARSRGIPIVTGIGEVAVEDGQLVAFDGRAGRFVVDPDDAVREEFRALIERRTAERDEAIRHAGEPAVSTDGHTVRVFANLGSVADAHAAARLGADGAGLVRTEVLFADRGTAPTVDEQADVYREISAALGGRPVTIRTWDVGGDKPLPFLPLPTEPNPFLGERGLRVFRHRPELLTDQLEAVCRVAREVPVRVMFPMVTTAEEVEWALGLLAALDPPEGLEVGIMVEVPAAALKVEHLVKGLDFVSIGTNDLTQYVTAADRGNTAVSALADGLDPAVLALIRRVAEQVEEVAVCGDLASDPDAAALLTGLGVTELSATAPQVPLVKARLRRTSLAAETARAGRALAARTATDVRRLLSIGGTEGMN